MKGYCSSTTVYFLGEDVEVNYNYTPARSAPIAHCSDQKGFDDEGDAEELEYEVVHGYPAVVETLEGSEDFYQALLEEIRS